jgi:hypothetical protein
MQNQENNINYSTMQKIVKAIALTLTLSATQIGFAMPAYHGDINFDQADGSQFAGNLKGDEWFNWVEDKNQNIIQYNKQSDNYEYSKLIVTNGNLDIVPGGVMVQNTALSPTNRMSALSSELPPEVATAQNTPLDSTNNTATPSTNQVPIVTQQQLRSIALRYKNEAMRGM